MAILGRGRGGEVFYPPLPTLYLSLFIYLPFLSFPLLFFFHPFSKSMRERKKRRKKRSKEEEKMEKEKIREYEENGGVIRAERKGK